MKKGILLTTLIGLLALNISAGDVKGKNNLSSVQNERNLNVNTVFNNYLDTPSEFGFLANYLRNNKKTTESTQIRLKNSKGQFALYNVLFRLVGKFGNDTSYLELVAKSNVGVTYIFKDYSLDGFYHGATEINSDKRLFNSKKDTYQSSKRQDIFNISKLSFSGSPSYNDVTQLGYEISKATADIFRQK
ncbi:MAG: hypothetical protein WC755_03890 [Candidatus Woesearchaeota archaeon]|jgi:hypothetical protein